MVAVNVTGPNKSSVTATPVKVTFPKLVTV